MYTDPTLEDMRAILNMVAQDTEEFDREEAIYWYAAEHHGGQNSNLYSALSQSKYNPGPISNGPSEAWLYNILVAEFGGTERIGD